MSVPERVAWAVGQVRPRPGMRVLEIGYGHGAAVDLLCSAGALVTGIDRSLRMLAAASRRNAAHLAAGVADLRTGALGRSALDGEFDAVLAVNVNAFWTGDARTEVAALVAALAPGGALHVCYEPPGPLDTLVARLMPAFAEVATTVATGSTSTGAALLCVTARPG